MRLFGWKRADGTRRYRTAYLEVAKKNGKSTILSAVSLYLLTSDGEGAPEGYINACDRAQADIIFRESSRMVAASPELKAHLEVIDSKKRIVYAKSNGVLIANSSVVDSKDGLNPSFVFFDELHRQPDRALFEVFEYASISRDQPLHIYITTAGEDEAGVWHEQRVKSEGINDGSIPDTTHLGVVYRADPRDDIDDPATWRKANPSLGVTMDEDEFRRKLEEAKRNPVALANFKRLRLNLITRGSDKLLPAEAWDLCNRPPGEIGGATVFGGLDLASTTDLAAFVWSWFDADDDLCVGAKFYLPEDSIVQAEHRDKVPYRVWAERGHLTLTPGSVIDYAWILADIVAFATENDLGKVFADPYNATQLCSQLAESHGVPVEFLRQGFLSLSSPTKELLRLVLAGRVKHGGHPVLTWNARNAVATSDPAGNLKLDKAKSRLKIDGMAALVNSLAGATSAGADSGRSVYETRGIFFL